MRCPKCFIKKTITITKKKGFNSVYCFRCSNTTLHQWIVDQAPFISMEINIPNATIDGRILQELGRIKHEMS